MRRTDRLRSSLSLVCLFGALVLAPGVAGPASRAAAQEPFARVSLLTADEARARLNPLIDLRPVQNQDRWNVVVWRVRELAATAEQSQHWSGESGETGNQDWPNAGIGAQQGRENSRRGVGRYRRRDQLALR
jgi:hypothetical protein